MFCTVIRTTRKVRRRESGILRTGAKRDGQVLVLRGDSTNDEAEQRPRKPVSRREILPGRRQLIAGVGQDMASRFEKLLIDGTDFDLWMAVAQAAFDRRWSRGLESLTEVQGLALAVWVASGMIGNRGFFDHSPEEMAEWAAAYDRLGMASAAQSIREASKLMLAIVWSREDPAEQKLDPIERWYYAANEQTAGVVAALIRERPTEAFAELT